MKDKMIFKWAGSKRRVYPKYQPFFYPSQDFNTFIDSFCGSAFVAKKVKEKNPNIKIVINDLNIELITLYRHLANNYDKLMKYYEGYVNDFVNLPLENDLRKPYYYEVRERYCLNRDCKDPIDLSSMLLFMLKINFNGIWKAYKKMDLFYSSPVGDKLDRKSLEFFLEPPHKEFSEFLKECDILCLPYDKIDIEGYDLPYVYLDPPYRDCSINYDSKGDSITGDKEQTRIIDHHVGCDCLFSFSNKETKDKFFTKIATSHNLNFRYFDVYHSAKRLSKDTERGFKREILIKNFS